MKDTSPPLFKRQCNGFTLIEMLVVIAIIALLTSLLSISVRSVLDKANTTKCMSNMRQIHVGILGYANDHNGSLPDNYGSNPGNPDIPNADGKSWPDRIAPYIDDKYDSAGNYISGSSPVFSCPARAVWGSEYTPYPLTYGVNRNILINRLYTENGRRISIFELGSLADVVMVADSGQVNGLTAGPSIEFAYFEHQWEEPMSLIGNTDQPGNFKGIRYRHKNNTAAVLLYADGHVGIAKANYTEDPTQGTASITGQAFRRL
ncbi:type II secretion system protein [Kiritimatiellota bacterium B12222]|nr:type II secretion system protein [Kiritimatiellota bacterium B12222]